tara:strand:- start:2229 stop:3233 length:1005 start_codon:yes stop_codon:yes gene_type:complete
MRNIQVPSSEHGSRFDRCLRRLVGYINQPLLEKSLRLGLILLDKKKTKSSFKVKSGQIIFYSNDINFEKIDKKPGFNNQTYIYYRNLYNLIFINESEEYIALNKPSGVAVQGGNSQKYHVDGMLKCLYKDFIVPKLVHRIDKDTSGLLLVAKDQQSAKKFSNYFKERRIIKTYLAIVSPCPKIENGIIDLPIYKSGQKGHPKMIVDHNRGKKAITEYKVLDKVSSRAALIALYPKTGRTHQLRVHLEQINCPIVGDKKYSGLSSVYSSDRSSLEHASVSQIKWSHKTIKNLQLHAHSIRMPSNELIEAEVSDNFKKTLNFLGLIIPKNIHKIFT